MVVTSTISPLLKVGLQLLGVWPGVYSTVHWLIYISSLLVVQYFQYLYVFAHFNKLSNLVDSLPLTLDYTLTCLKVAGLWIHRRVMREILTAMDNDWRACIGIEQHLYTMTIKANLSHFCFNVTFSFITIVAILYFFGDYTLQAMHIFGDYNNTLRQLPMKVQLPFQTQESPIFELLVVTLFLYNMSNVLVTAVLNGLIFSLILHVSGQINIICQEFRIISEKIRLCESSTSTLRILIERHNRIISLSYNMEKLLSFIALMQVVWNTLVSCSLGFIFIISFYTEADVFVLIKAFLAYVTVMVEIFVLCFAGEYLSLKSKLIADAAYDSLWYDMPSNQSKIIIFIIMRSHLRLKITAGKLIDLSLEAFASILKASASYISVFHAIY